MANVTVSGLDSLKVRLDALPRNMVQNIFRKAVRQAANLIAAKARTNFVGAVVAIGGARSDTANPQIVSGALKASIRVVPRRGTPDRVVFNVVAGDLSSAQKKTFSANSAYYALWVERGHINRKMGNALRGSRAFKLNSRATSESNTPAHPFMAPAVVSEGDAAIELIIESVTAQLGQL